MLAATSTEEKRVVQAMNPGNILVTLGQRHRAHQATAICPAYVEFKRGGRLPPESTKVGNHTFRASGITAYLKNGRTLE